MSPLANSNDLPVIKNLFADMPSKAADELVEVLAQSRDVRIERIVSTGHRSPDGFWYDQEEHEWVVVLKGAATLRFEDDANPTQMRPGDFINIPAHRKHRVEATSTDEPTVWLALHYSDRS